MGTTTIQNIQLNKQGERMRFVNLTSHDIDVVATGNPVGFRGK